MNNKKRLLFFILFFPLFGYSQKSATLSHVDSFALTIKYKTSLADLTRRLTDHYSEELLKARAIFKWITENIQYDYKYYNKYYYKDKEPKAYKCKNDSDCEAKRIAWETKYIDKVLRKKKAVCQGYSMLFKKMCDIAGLKSEVIPGYTRTEYYQVGTAGKLDHAWNAIWIDTSYHLLDATWAAGGCAKNDDGKLLSFQKYFDNYYWLTPAVDFARNHYPKDSKWTLLSNYTKDSFAANPYYLPSEIRHLKLIKPSSGILSVKKGDTIHFTLAYASYFSDLQINSNIFRNPDIWVLDEVSKKKQIRRIDTLAVKKQQYIKYNREATVYNFQYVVTDNTLSYLDILFDKKRVLRFKVKIYQQEH